MSAMKAKELRSLTDDELLAKGRDLRQEMFHLRIQQQSGQIEKPSRIRELRRAVARVETILSERRRAKQQSTSPTK
jgi:large subunit ribosomal protein L29